MIKLIARQKGLFLLLFIIFTLCADYKLVKLDTRDFEIDYFDVRVEEVKREDSVSVVQITRSSGPSGDESMFVIRTLCLIAKERGKRYFLILEEGENEEGIYTYRVGFLNEPIENLKGHFGIIYDKPVTEKVLMDSEDLMKMFGW